MPLLPHMGRPLLLQGKGHFWSEEKFMNQRFPRAPPTVTPQSNIRKCEDIKPIFTSHVARIQCYNGDKGLQTRGREASSQQTRDADD